MSVEAIRAALEGALNSMSPSLQTAWENTSFVTTAGVPYQRVWWPDFLTENPTQGSGFHRVRSYMQIDLMYPLQTGTTAIRARAELIKALFKKGATFTSGGVTVTIETTPVVGGGVPDGDRYKVVVKFIYFANIFS